MPAELYIFTRHWFIDGNFPSVSGSKPNLQDLHLLAPKLDPLGTVEYWREVYRFKPMPVDPLDKWCYTCGCTRPRSYFYPRTDTWDKLEPRCKECERQRKRDAYAVKKGLQGKTVRPYLRHDAEQITAASA